MNSCSTPALRISIPEIAPVPSNLIVPSTTYPPELIEIAQNRVQYLKEIDRLQPIAVTSKTMEPLIQSVSERINDAKPTWLAHPRPGLWQMAACGPRYSRHYLAAFR